MYFLLHIYNLYPNYSKRVLLVKIQWKSNKTGWGFLIKKRKFAVKKGLIFVYNTKFYVIIGCIVPKESTVYIDF